jgi:metal-responsive CopG/Arc/MetJ family transcriptional regulator
MKAVQVLFNEHLLSRFDADADVKNSGRSAVLRRIVAEYLARKREVDIDARYRNGYADGVGLGSEFEGWENEAAWPDK